MLREATRLQGCRVRKATSLLVKKALLHSLVAHKGPVDFLDVWFAVFFKPNIRMLNRKIRIFESNMSNFGMIRAYFDLSWTKFDLNFNFVANCVAAVTNFIAVLANFVAGGWGMFS